MRWRADCQRPAGLRSAGGGRAEASSACARGPDRTSRPSEGQRPPLRGRCHAHVVSGGIVVERQRVQVHRDRAVGEGLFNTTRTRALARSWARSLPGGGRRTYRRSASRPSASSPPAREAACSVRRARRTAVCRRRGRLARAVRGPIATAVRRAALAENGRGGEVQLRIVPVVCFGHPDEATAAQVPVEPSHQCGGGLRRPRSSSGDRAPARPDVRRTRARRRRERRRGGEDSVAGRRMCAAGPQWSLSSRRRGFPAARAARRSPAPSLRGCT